MHPDYVSTVFKHSKMTSNLKEKKLQRFEKLSKKRQAKNQVTPPVEEPTPTNEKTSFVKATRELGEFLNLNKRTLFG